MIEPLINEFLQLKTNPRITRKVLQDKQTEILTVIFSQCLSVENFAVKGTIRGNRICRVNSNIVPDFFQTILLNPMDHEFKSWLVEASLKEEDFKLILKVLYFLPELNEWSAEEFFHRHDFNNQDLISVQDK